MLADRPRVWLALLLVIREETFQRETSQLPCPALQVLGALLDQRIPARRIPAEPVAELRGAPAQAPDLRSVRDNPGRPAQMLHIHVLEHELPGPICAT
eukprot:5257605-Alexandrium_andersonii.AAC.1